MNSRKQSGNAPVSNSPMSGRFGSMVMGGRTRATSTAIALLLLSSTLVGCSGLSSTTPNAKISSDQQQINIGETVNFDARESSTPEPTFIDEYRWDFGTARLGRPSRG